MRVLLAMIAVLGSITYCLAQEASHSHGMDEACATGHCAECVRVPDIRKKQVPVYSCREKEICIPRCGLLALFGCKGDCHKIVVRQLVKKFRTEEECVMKCMTAEEAAKKYEADAKKAAESRPVIPALAPARLPVVP